MGIGKEFGDFFKKKRRALGLTLREFCRINEIDPGNLSKIERGLMAPPQSKEKQLEYAVALGIEEGTDDWYTFCDLAKTSAGKIPSDMASNEEVMKALPILFRSVRERELKEEDIERLFQTIRRGLR